jgi:hypothetical protein
MERRAAAPRARYVCDLHEIAHRYYRSIEPAGEPEGTNELARLVLFEQVTRRLPQQGSCHAKSPGRCGLVRHDLAIFGQLVPGERPFAATSAQTGAFTATSSREGACEGSERGNED